ncbi:MAG: Nif3-like dinuclear metal center hexameric protein [Flavobacteriales bacterium]|jgi:dinuclear metal center YbgI/SA1388 family protein|nr:Nif3-like dinuclear metal center hexameric protein [Flavobacteriales bacterium]|tara:strand:+ start:8207 stop:9304 length:1098 start_codon:yes stop_codon:yes gene_type:complete
MKLFEISNYLDTRVPLAFQEEYDNCGLLIGNKSSKINSVLISLDCTESVVDEAIRNKHNLIISHHPLLFNGIKKITGSNYVERITEKAIRNNIAIYSMHTNLDNIQGGVSFQIAKRISLQDVKVLKPKTNLLSYLVVYCPKTHTQDIKKALHSVGAGQLGSFYDNCSFVSSGIGSFRPLPGSNSFSGKIGENSYEEEDKIEVIYYSYLQSKVLTALKEAHPYQEIAYSCCSLINDSQVGSGVIGTLSKEITLKKFLNYVKKQMNISVIKYTLSHNQDKIKKIAICGGSGSFLLEDAIKNDADVYISSDFKYHDFFNADNKISVFDIGHYESEYYTQHLIYDILKEKFSKLAIHLTSVCTNPVLYY